MEVKDMLRDFSHASAKDAQSTGFNNRQAQKVTNWINCFCEVKSFFLNFSQSNRALSI